MDYPHLFLEMFFNIAAICFVATLLCRMRWFRNVFWNVKFGRRERVLFITCFSFIGMMATSIGTEINGAILNCRMIAAFSSGLLGGPFVGICTGLLTAAHRYFFYRHSITALACACSTLMEAAVGVLLHRRYAENRIPIPALVGVSALIEVMQMVFILCIARPFPAALEVVRVFALPMIVMNTCGELLFIQTFRQILDEADNEAAIRVSSRGEQRLKAEQSKRLLARAEFINLQSQVNPHFLFNCLNTISYYLGQKPQKAKEMLRRLADYYRYSADELTDFVTLDTELNHIKTYLELEKARFEDSLRAEVTIASDVDMSAKVPSLILQPIVENAVKYGRDDKGIRRILVSIRREGRALVIDVVDSGEGIPDEVIAALRNDEMPQNKVGLQNVNKRLQLLTGRGLDITAAAGGSRVSIVLK